MALPKEPRQMMINIMYLVLTALLALNVSAEIFNAFEVVEKGLKKSNAVLDENNSHLPSEISKLAKKKKDLETYAERTTPIRDLSREYTGYIDEIMNYMIEASGGYLEDGTVKGFKDKDITTRYLVNEGKGDELEGRLVGLKDAFLEYVDPQDRERMASEISIDIDDAWKNSEKKSWADYNFRQMPLLATMPIFEKLKNDIKSAESTMLNYLLNKVGGEDIVFDNYQVVMQSKKGYVIAGEPFEADFFLSTSASGNTNAQISVSVNGSPVAVKDGVAHYSTGTSSTGIKQVDATISVTNPVTGEKSSYSNTFTYEVGERSASVSAEKMNVLYVGVDNPLSITAAGISSNDLQVSATGSGISIAKTGNGKYNATVSQQGESKITLSGGGLTPTTYSFRTKIIPDPVPTLSGQHGGTMGNGQFKAQQALIPQLENFDFDARCEVLSYTLFRVPKPGTGDAVASTNQGGTFNAASRSLIEKASPNDRYFFEDVRVKCPGWPTGKNVGTVSFKIQ